MISYPCRGRCSSKARITSCSSPEPSLRPPKKPRPPRLSRRTADLRVLWTANMPVEELLKLGWRAFLGDTTELQVAADLLNELRVRVGAVAPRGAHHPSCLPDARGVRCVR